MLPFQTRFLMSLLENFDLKGFVKSVRGYLNIPPKFSTELANLKLKFIGNTLETPWYTRV